MTYSLQLSPTERDLLLKTGTDSRCALAAVLELLDLADDPVARPLSDMLLSAVAHGGERALFHAGQVGRAVLERGRPS